jgi:formamidopyrimidine-DNA glycosylase
MPELPEVETTLRGLKPHLEGQIIQGMVIRHTKLRWPIPLHLKTTVRQRQVHQLSRRGKYLLLHVDNGTIIMHLGMSGSLRLLTQMTPAQSHDHMDILLANNQVLRYTDPRRFGTILWTAENPQEHRLLNTLGVEPLSKDFTAQYLQQKTIGRSTPIKSWIMNSKMVTGIGNIYATEALFLASIHPITPSRTLTDRQYHQLVLSIKKILRLAIKKGGTTLKDFVDSTGKPGYFAQQLKVYGRSGLPCVQCNTVLHAFMLQQRTTVVCSVCQPQNPPL